ncbi:hypothetical protein [Shinella sumterensis]|uniref:hypothetical protein n=1 Tax=Shinella sumterensis TaxID=1967501 RepID=UPI0014300234|nr:hypothetical protein [Shinella sumterensis]MCD1264576.1 hypothetical protein [Shinella sumterensis]
MSDEASKLGDSTRQLAAAVSGALFGGIGLVVARLTMSTSSAAVAAGVLLIGFVLCLYVTVTIVSGRQFVSIQRDLRQQWRGRLYRFIPEKEYENLVTSPADRAEAAFKLASWISGVLAAVMMIAVFCVTVPELWESAKAWHNGSARDSDDKPARGTCGPPAVLDDQLIVAQPCSLQAVDELSIPVVFGSPKVAAKSV